MAPAAVPTVAPRPLTSVADTVKPEPVRPSVPRSVMCGARNPRLTLAVRFNPAAGVATTPARNVTLDASSESSGHSGLPFTTRAVGGLRPVVRAAVAHVADRRSLPGTTSNASCA